MLFTDAFTVNCWRLTIGNKTNDKLIAREVTGRCWRPRARMFTIENGSQTSRGEVRGRKTRFTVPGGALWKHARWCIIRDSYGALTLRQSRRARDLEARVHRKACKSRSRFNLRLSLNCISRKEESKACFNSNLKQTIKRKAWEMKKIICNCNRDVKLIIINNYKSFKFSLLTRIHNVNNFRKF